MKKNFSWLFLSLLALSLLLLGVLVSGAGAAEKIQVGGTLTYLDITPTLNPMTWDIDDWNWKHGYDTGFYMEHLLVGDLQKGPRGAKKTLFHNNAWVPPDLMTGELLEKWEVKKKPPCRSSFTFARGLCGRKNPGS